MLLSGSGGNREGPNHLYFPEFDTPEQNHGIAEHLDYERHNNVFGKFSWGAFSLEGANVERTKGVPTASYEQLFNDRASRTEDRRTFITATYNEQFQQDWDVYLRLNYHQYVFKGTYPMGSPKIINKDLGRGEWWDSEFRLTNTSFSQHKLMVGVEIQDNLQQLLQNYDVDGATYLNIPYSSVRYGGYIQDEYQPFDTLRLGLGARYDYNPLGGSSANPRVSVIWQALESTTLKLLYGTAFRAPNVSERFYFDSASYKANPGVKPETIRTLEVILEHFFSPSTRFSTSYYHYDSKKLINQQTDPNDGLIFYGNIDSAIADGLELEGEQRFGNYLQARASYVWQQVKDNVGNILINSPQHQAKLNISARLWSDQWHLGFETQYMSSRLSLTNRVNDNVITNINLNADLFKNFGMSFGVYNLWDMHYHDPMSEGFVQDSIAQDGRTFRIKLTLKL